ncbi:MAG: hypothetical protein IPM74_09305 [Crocinitomicaceae bacterium]|nr:hypothetical protein [Crocinitomicaceae bacterium]MBK8926089.1 hypothetical protein [Crocinitomicaceae bacterium]
MKRAMKMMMLALLMIVANITMAQEGKEGDSLTVEQRADKRTQKMKQELSLTEAQVKLIYDINLAHITKMEQYRAEMKILREKIKAEKESTRLKIKEVLTPEQNVIFDQKLEEHKKKEQEKHPEPHRD